MNQILKNNGQNNQNNQYDQYNQYNNEFNQNPYFNQNMNNNYNNNQLNQNIYENQNNSVSYNTYDNTYENLYDNIKPKKHRKNYTFQYSKNKGFGKPDIANITKIFSITIIVLGVILIARSVFALTNNPNKLKDTPEVTTEKMGKEVTISVSTQKPIKEYSYKWNEGSSTNIQGNGTVNMSTTIDIPNGNNILKIEVTDYYGNKTQYQKQYIYESSDIQKPVIEIGQIGNKLKITAKDETELLYMTYQWNDEEVQRFDAQNGQKEISQEIDVAKGQSKLTVIAVDKEENKATRTENIIGATKPTFDIQTQDKNIIIKATDEEGIDKISITLDGITTDSGDQPINQKEITASLPAERGQHSLIVKVTNINGLETTKEALVAIQ